MSNVLIVIIVWARAKGYMDLGFWRGCNAARCDVKGTWPSFLSPSEEIVIKFLDCQSRPVRVILAVSIVLLLKSVVIMIFVYLCGIDQVCRGVYCFDMALKVIFYPKNL